MCSTARRRGRRSFWRARRARRRCFPGRAHVVPDDIKLIGPDVLRHRVVITYEAEAEDKTADDVIRLVFDHVEVP
jgi:MoxR-like ATPase